MLTKAEMEDIWRNKPVGYFSDLKKNMKKQKRFKVTLKPYSIKKHDEVVGEYLATNKENAVWMAKNRVSADLRNLGIEFDGYYHTVYEV